MLALAQKRSQCDRGKFCTKCVWASPELVQFVQNGENSSNTAQIRCDEILPNLDKTGVARDRPAMIMTFLQVALGGAIGAMLRFGTGLAVIRLAGQGFPLAILTVNIVGSFLMGLFVVFSFQRGFEHLNLFVMTGILGGFTTFSAFSLETFSLFERGQPMAAGLYILLSVLLSVAALVLGIWIARGIWA